jgi:hypothetical protein
MRSKITLPIVDVKKYGGKQVAIVEGKVVASGDTLEEVLRRANKKMPSRPLHEIKVFAVPKTMSVIYYVS